MSQSWHSHRQAEGYDDEEEEEEEEEGKFDKRGLTKVATLQRLFPSPCRAFLSQEPRQDSKQHQSHPGRRQYARRRLRQLELCC